jgi:arabinan endo-1,5-alpha-L-arabinosidase
MFLNKNQWPVVAPYEYNGEQITDADMKQPMSLTNKDIIGTYQLLVHKYRLDHNNMEEVTPVTISLNADGTITGSKTGTWSIDEGTHYITLNMSNSIYYGVVYEETMDYTNMHAVAITAVSNGGVSVWAYKLHPKYELAYQVKTQKLPVSNNKNI